MIAVFTVSCEALLGHALFLERLIAFLFFKIYEKHNKPYYGIIANILIVSLKTLRNTKNSF